MKCTEDMKAEWIKPLILSLILCLDGTIEFLSLQPFKMWKHTFVETTRVTENRLYKCQVSTIRYLRWDIHMAKWGQKVLNLQDVGLVMHWVPAGQEALCGDKAKLKVNYKHRRVLDTTVSVCGGTFEFYPTTLPFHRILWREHGDAVFRTTVEKKSDISNAKVTLLWNRVFSNSDVHFFPTLVISLPWQPVKPKLNNPLNTSPDMDSLHTCTLGIQRLRTRTHIACHRYSDKLEQGKHVLIRIGWYLIDCFLHRISNLHG